MNMKNLLARLYRVRNAPADPHAQRMCVLGYLGAMNEMNAINGRQYMIASDIADNACAYRRKELDGAL